MTLWVSDEKIVFALLDATKHSIDYNNSYFYLDVTDLIVDDYMQKIMYNKPFEESLDDPQEENTPFLHNKDETEVQVHKKQWRVNTHGKKGKNKPLLNEVTYLTKMIGKFPIFFYFGLGTL